MDIGRDSEVGRLETAERIQAEDAEERFEKAMKRVATAKKAIIVQEDNS